jgi:hypothetical protein
MLTIHDPLAEGAGMKQRGTALWGRTLLIALLAATAFGCQAAYHKSSHGVMHHYRNGDYVAAVPMVNDLAERSVSNANNPNKILWRMEQGAILRASGDYSASNAAFDDAEARADAEAARGGQAALTEGVAFLSNQGALTYLGYDYDLIMVNVYKALNYMSMDMPDPARVELTRALNRQQDAVAANTRRIENIEKQAEQKKKDYDAERAKNDPRFQQQIEENYPDIEKFKAYANYVNPFAEFLQGLFFMATAEDSSDTERAVKSMERVAGMLDARDYIAQDLALAEEIANGRKMPAMTYVIFETGVAPKRGQTRIDIPVFVASRDVPYVGAAFPKLEFDTDYTTPLEAVAGGQSFTTQLLCDMDAVIYTEFNNRLPEVITKTLVAAGTRAAAQYGVQQAARGNSYAYLAAMAVGVTYQAATNEADLRTWRTLPKQFQYCRFPTPDDRTVTLRLPFTGATQTVTLDEGHVNVIVARAARAAAPLAVTQFKLK